MEEFIPYLLILISWHPDEPGKFTIERAPVVFANLEECNAHGREYVAQREIYHIEFGERRFDYKCIKSASSEETDKAWLEMEDQKASQK